MEVKKGGKVLPGVSRRLVVAAVQRTTSFRGFLPEPDPESDPNRLIRAKLAAQAEPPLPDSGLVPAVARLAAATRSGTCPGRCRPQPPGVAFRVLC